MDAIGGVSLVVIIMIAVEFAKRGLGVKGRWAPAVALVFGVGISLFAYAATIWPAARGPLDALVAGLVAAASAAGIYSGGKAMVSGGSDTSGGQ